MKLAIVLIPGFVALSHVAYAGDIYKCEGPDGIAYGDTPCTAQHSERLVSTSANRVNWQRSDGDASVPVPTTLALPFSGMPLSTGMTDTQVLNLPNWGRPARIVRSRAGRMWREQWVYRNRWTGDERSLLYFENGRLLAQEDVPQSPSLQARATTE